MVYSGVKEVIRGAGWPAWAPEPSQQPMAVSDQLAARQVGKQVEQRGRQLGEAIWRQLGLELKMAVPQG